MQGANSDNGGNHSASRQLRMGREDSSLEGAHPHLQEGCHSCAGGFSRNSVICRAGEIQLQPTHLFGLVNSDVVVTFDSVASGD